MTTTALPAIRADQARPLLLAGAIAAPLWASVSLAQAATREGFDLTRHPLSALANGDLGWLQIVNFMASGVLTILGAIGLARALRGAPGGRWTPRLVATTGLGMTLAGPLVMDAGDGFPAGTPAGIPSTMSWHSYGHMAAGTVSFTALIAACFVLGHHFHRAGRHGMAVASRIAGAALLVGELWAMTGGRAGSLTLAVGAITAMLWICVVCAALARRATQNVG
jgi:hypothetical protein